MTNYTAIRAEMIKAGTITPNAAATEELECQCGATIERLVGHAWNTRCQTCASVRKFS